MTANDGGGEIQPGVCISRYSSTFESHLAHKGPDIRTDNGAEDSGGGGAEITSQVIG